MSELKKAIEGTKRIITNPKLSYVQDIMIEHLNLLTTFEDDDEYLNWVSYEVGGE